MADLDFYNQNEHRRYPFTPDADMSFSGGYEIPDFLILDCGFTLGGLSGFNIGYRPGPQTPDYVRLTKIKRLSATKVEFTFVASSMPAYPFVFVRNIADGVGAVDYVEANSSPTYGVGFLVTGNLSSLFDVGNPYYIATEITPVDDGPEIEQATIVALSGQGVDSINIGNLPRVLTPGPQPAMIVKVVANDLENGVTIAPGYNVAVRPDEDNNRFEILPIIGAGKGKTCGEIERYPGEDTGSGLLSGGLPCNDLIYTVNGTPPASSGDFILRASNGLRVELDGDNNRVVIIADLTDVVFCGGT